MPATVRPVPTAAEVDAAIETSSSKARTVVPRARSAAGGAAAPRAATCADLEGGTDKLPPGPPAITVTPRPAAIALRARRGGRAAARVRTSAPMVSAARANPAANTDFQRAVIQIRSEAARQRKHDLPNVKRQQVEKSAVLDKVAQAQQSSENRNVAAMGVVGQKQLAQSATFKDAKAKKFKEDFHAIVDANPPATEDDARKLANREQAVQPFEGPFSKNLADQQAVVTKPLDQRAKNEPAVEIAPLKEAKAIPRPVYPPAPGPVNPALVVPEPKPDVEASVKEDSDRLDGAMQKNRLDDDQLANSREPSFLKTLKAKQDAQQKIVDARNAYRRQEASILQGATAQANQSMSTELAGMSRAHTRTGGVVHTGQKGTESDTQRRQREIKKAIDDIYKWTAEGVAEILKCMTTKVTEDFRNSLKTQTEAFNDNVTKALGNYYSFVKKAKHLFLGEPKVVVNKKDGSTRDLTAEDWDRSTFPPRIITPWINPEVYDIFKEEKKKFTDAMEAQLDVIAADVEKGLTAASERIKVGIAKVTAYKNTLTGNEKRFADELEEDVRARFQSLEASIDDARQDLLKSLADEYRESVNQLETTFNDINEEMRKSWLDRAIEFVETVGKTIFQLAELLFSILVRVAYLVWDIVKHPIRFFETLVAGLKQGISDFIDDIGTHLKEAFWTWLTDATPGTTIRLSLNAGVAGLFDLVMQVLRLGPADLRAIVDKVLGPEFMQMVDKGVAFAEKAFEPIVILFTKGPVAFWEYIKEQLEDIIQSSFDRIKESVFIAFVKKGILWIAGFFVPGGGFVKVVKAIVKAFQFVAENLERIKRFFDAVFDSMEAATQGNSAGVASKIVTGLKMGIVLALGFLAKQLGLDSIIASVHKILHSLRRPIVNAIEWLLRKVKPLVDKIVRGVSRAVAGAKGAVRKVAGWLGLRKVFKAADGRQHALYFGEGGQLIVATAPKGVRALLKEIRLAKAGNIPKELGEAEGILAEIDSVTKRHTAAQPAGQQETESIANQINGLLEKLAAKLAGLLGPSDLPLTGIIYKMESGLAMMARAKPLTRRAGNTTPSKSTSAPIPADPYKVALNETRELWVKLHLVSWRLMGPNQTWNLAVGDKSVNGLMETLETNLEKKINGNPPTSAAEPDERTRWYETKVTFWPKNSAVPYNHLFVKTVTVTEGRFDPAAPAATGTVHGPWPSQEPPAKATAVVVDFSSSGHVVIGTTLDPRTGQQLGHTVGRRVVEARLALENAEGRRQWQSTTELSQYLRKVYLGQEKVTQLLELLNLYPTQFRLR